MCTRACVVYVRLVCLGVNMMNVALKIAFNYIVYLGRMNMFEQPEKLPSFAECAIGPDA